MSKDERAWDSDNGLNGSRRWNDRPALAERRQAMIAAIESEVRELDSVLGRSSLDARVIEAMRRVPRHMFVPETRQSAAYENRALAIGYGQTISQPLIVALMTDLLSIERGANVLEIGTGSGYQAAVLAELGATVHSIEVIRELAVEAQQQLSALGDWNVTVRVGDGRRGWPEHAPYDRIIVTAACADIPPSLENQLKLGGRMVVPICGDFGAQWLTLVEKDQNGRTTKQPILAVAFVPLVGSGDSMDTGRTGLAP